MKDDSISRQAAIDALSTPHGILYPIRTIEELPSAQPEQRWIPCSERLPEESGRYIITAHDGTCKRTSFAIFQKTYKRWDLNGARAYWKVYAWMPLPEPYQEGEQND